MVHRETMGWPLRRLLSSLSLAFAAGLPGCAPDAVSATPAKAETPLPVKTAKIRRGDLSKPIAVVGVLAARHELDLSFKVSGLVTKVYVEQGRRVATGQLLAELDPTEYEARLTETRHTLEKAERDLARTRSLRANDAASLAAAEDADTSLALARAAFEAAAYNVHHTKLYAPGAGVVDQRLVHPGEIVAPGRASFHISGTKGGLVARVGIIDSDVLAVQVGSRARVTVDALPGKSFAAVVSELDNASGANMGVFSVQLTFVDPLPSHLPAGLPLHAEVERVERDTVGVPLASLVRAQGYEALVFVVDGSRARPIPVKIRGTSGDLALLTDDIDNVDAVIADGAQFVRPGALVQVLP